VFYFISVVNITRVNTIQIHVLTSDWQAREAELTKLKLESERERVREQNVN